MEIQEPILFTCPNCQKEFSLEQFLKHNSQPFEKLVAKRANALVDEKEAKIRREEKEKQEGIMTNRLLEQEKQFSMKFSDLKQEKLQNELSLKNQYSELKTKFDGQKENYELQIKDRVQQASIELEKKLTNKDLEILNLKNMYGLQEEKMKSTFASQLQTLTQAKKELIDEITVLKIQQAKDLEIAIQNEAKRYREEIFELKSLNDRNRLLHSKTKGENFEHEVEGELRKTFGFVDFIEKINDADKKADFLQIIRDETQNEVGRIVYEVKNAEWKDSWLGKLKVDAANKGTKYAILVATSFDQKYHEVPFVKSDESDSIFISDPNSFIFVAQILRQVIIAEHLYNQKIKTLSAKEDNALLESYQKKVQSITAFMTETLPLFKKSFDKQLEDLDSVAKSLDKNANVVIKVRNQLEKEFKTKIQEKLEKIIR